MGEGDRHSVRGRQAPDAEGWAPRGEARGGPRPGRGAESQAGKMRIHSRRDTGRGVWMWAAGATS